MIIIAIASPKKMSIIDIAMKPYYGKGYEMKAEKVTYNKRQTMILGMGRNASNCACH